MPKLQTAPATAPRKVEATEPTAPVRTLHEDTGMEFITPEGATGNAEDIKASWTVDELRDLGIVVSSRVKLLKNDKKTPYLLATMNGKYDTVFFSAKMRATVKEGDKLKKDEVAFYTIAARDENGKLTGKVFTLCGKVGGGLEEWD